MKILIYGINFRPEIVGVGKYTGELAEFLAVGGHEVTVVCAPPYYPEWSARSGWPLSVWSRRRESGLRVVRCPIYVPKMPGGARRILHLLSFMLSSAPVMMVMLIWRPKLVFVVEPSFVCVPASVFFRFLCGSKLWLHVQDLEVDAAFDLGLLPNRFGIRRLVEAVEAGLMACFGRVSTISRKMIEKLVIKGVQRERLYFFPNWVDLAGFVDPVPEAIRLEFRSRLNIGHSDVVALYSGNMGGKQGLEILGEVVDKCEALFLASSSVSFSRLVFVFCGNGPGRAELEACCAGKVNVRFLDLLPVNEFRTLLSAGDIHLLPQKVDAADLVMPSKLTGMAASGRPVVATAAPGTELAQVVERFGVVVPPADGGSFAEAVFMLARDCDLRLSLGAAAREYAFRNFEKDEILNGFSKALLEYVEVGCPD